MYPKVLAARQQPRNGSKPRRYALCLLSACARIACPAKPRPSRQDGVDVGGALLDVADSVERRREPGSVLYRCRGSVGPEADDEIARRRRQPIGPFAAAISVAVRSSLKSSTRRWCLSLVRPLPKGKNKHTGWLRKGKRSGWKPRTALVRQSLASSGGKHQPERQNGPALRSRLAGECFRAAHPSEEPPEYGGFFPQRERVLRLTLEGGRGRARSLHASRAGSSPGGPARTYHLSASTLVSISRSH